MGLEDVPEVKLARRILRKHSLEVPFDLEQLIKQYANLLYRPIDVEGVDGVSINLKTPGKKPTVLVNENLSAPRKKFTLAHELGHIVIPWHVGTIVDEAYEQSLKDVIYATLEQEANRFAAELLMPKDWILREYQTHQEGLSKLHQHVVAQAGVSYQAAAIRMIQILPPNILFVLERKGKVENAGKTANTGATLPSVGDHFSKVTFPYLDGSEQLNHGPLTYYWYSLSTSISVDTNGENRSWRMILEEILSALYPEDEALKVGRKVNGIISLANGQLRIRPDYSVDLLVSEAILRLIRPGLESFSSHPDFEKFVKIRAQDFFK